ncbi:MAG: exodeoxyribonuclease VII small subunit [Firmicutes bacterium]|nr:exodeoxyribonuclease VII small subunit [Bacillota bacterium]
MNFEESMAKLEQLAELIRDEETSLDDSLKCYEEGMKYYDMCCTILEKAQQTIEVYEKPIY